MKKEYYELWLDILRIGNSAVRDAQDENRRLGLPNVYERNGITVYELPDGTITKDRPEILKRDL